MNREDASSILWWASKRHYPGDQMDITAEDIEAFDIAIAILREPAHEWVRTTDRLPMVEQVVVGLCGGKVDIYQMVNIDDFKRYVEYWCALPLLPEVEG